MSLTGDFAGLGRLRQNLEKLIRVPSRAAALAAPVLKREVGKQFTRGVDPYGSAWAPLAPATRRRGRHAPPLTATGRMRGSVSVRPMPGAGIGLTIDFPAELHQRGTRHMPARRILPAAGFPKTWEAALERASRAAFTEAGMQ